MGVVVNHTSISKEGKHLIEIIHSAGIKIYAVFSPEHGYQGIAQAGEKLLDGIEPLTGAPIFSLYGKSKKPSQNMLKGLKRR